MSISPIVLKRTYPVSARSVFNAWTQPDLMSQWFFVQKGWSARAKNDLRIEGKFHLDMVAPDNKVSHYHGVYQEITPFSKLSFTWNSARVANTLLTIVLKDDIIQTDLTLTHQYFKTQAEQDSQQPGWIECLENLEKFLTQKL